MERIYQVWKKDEKSPDDVMIEIERAAEEEGTSAQAVVRSVLRIWAKRREKSRHE